MCLSFQTDSPWQLNTDIFTLNSHRLSVQTHHQNSSLILGNFFCKCEEIQSKLHGIVLTLLQ